MTLLMWTTSKRQSLTSVLTLILKKETNKLDIRYQQETQTSSRWRIKASRWAKTEEPKQNLPAMKREGKSCGAIFASIY